TVDAAEQHPFWSPPESANNRQAISVAASVIVLCALTVVAVRRLDQLPVRSDAGVFLTEDGSAPVDLPAFVGVDWIGRRAEVTQVERDILPPDTGYSRRNYVALHQPGRQVFLSIVLSGRDRSSIHRPELCVAGQGWTITGRTSETLDFPGREGENFTATVLRIEHKMGDKKIPALLAYWFVSSNRVVATHGERMLFGAWDRLRNGRAD